MMARCCLGQLAAYEMIGQTMRLAPTTRALSRWSRYISAPRGKEVKDSQQCCVLDPRIATDRIVFVFQYTGLIQISRQGGGTEGVCVCVGGGGGGGGRCLFLRPQYPTVGVRTSPTDHDDNSHTHN